MLEALIISLCLGDYACGDAMKAYSKTKDGSAYIRNSKKMLYQYIDKESVAALGTFIAAASNRKVKIRVTRSVFLEGNKDQMGVYFRYDF